jgi:hypothetical protein
MTTRVAMWSGPRNISTAMMRSFGARGDCVVSDEPLYGHYLTHTKLDHPLKDEVMASQPNDWQSVVQTLQGDAPGGHPLWYQKHMTHHLLAHIDRAWMKEVRHCFLIRDPKEVLASYARSRAEVTLEDLGFEAQAEIFDWVTNTLGQPALVLDSSDILKSPAQMLEKLCMALEIPYSQEMLRWEPGLRESDGVWAPHWYHSVVDSRGFAPYRERFPEYPGALAPIAEAARAYYEPLYEKRMQLI